MLNKIKENWLIYLFLILLVVFVLLRIFLLTKKDDTSSINKTNIEPSPTTTNVTNEPETFEIDQDRDDILEQMPVRKFSILEFVPYEEDDFEIIKFDDKTNKLFVIALVIDKEIAKKSFNNFLERYISEDSQKTFEVIWQ